MAKEKSPAFQFYPREFLADGNVSGMSLQERGAYITLLCVCWNDGSLPTDTRRLANMVATPHTAFLKFWPAVRACFAEQGDRFIHQRLERERAKQASHRERATDRGVKGAESRWSKHAPAIEQASPKHAPSTAQAMPSDSSPVSDLRSPVSVLRKSPSDSRPNARSKWPIFKGHRLVVFDWQLEDVQGLLAPNGEDFAFDELFQRIDDTCVRDGLVPPDRDGGAWLKAQVIADAQARGVPLRVASTDSGTNVAAVESILRRQGVIP